MILVTTPTGKIGKPLVQNLLSENPGPIRVLVRDASRLELPAGVSVEIVEGSLADPRALRKACEGVASLFWCLPDSPTAEDYSGYYEKIAVLGCAAIRRHNIARVVAVSAAGPTPATPGDPITALHRMEAILSKSGAALRFLRCGSFFENLLWQADSILNDGRFVYTLPGHVRTPQLATEDIARVAARWLRRGDWHGQETVSLLGPEDLSFNEVARVLSTHLDRSVCYEAMMPDAYRELLAGLGYSRSAARGLVQMFDHLEYGYADDPFADRLQTPTTLAEWIGKQPAFAGKAASPRM